MLSEQWEDSQGLVVRISQLETRFLSCEGVLDVGDTTLNGAAQNLQLSGTHIPKRGEIANAPLA